jgi:hypothetical protein
MEDKYIDITYDVRNDSDGRDPDSASRTLRHYHKLLWSKCLPNGKSFNLEEIKNKPYLYHKSELGEYYLSSDSVVHTYFRWKQMQHIIEEIPKDEMKYFYDLAYTIGGFIIFPGDRRNGLHTINQERGMSRLINDRMDLTLECIRRYYINENSPMMDTIGRYSDFFSLFSDFKGYCEYFLLRDLVLDSYSRVNFFLPFKDFVVNPLPTDVDEYNEYKKNNIEFLQKRNNRISEYNDKI